MDRVNGVVPYLANNPELGRDPDVRELTLLVALDFGTYQRHGQVVQGSLATSSTSLPSVLDPIRQNKSLHRTCQEDADEPFPRSTAVPVPRFSIKSVAEALVWGKHDEVMCKDSQTPDLTISAAIVFGIWSCYFGGPVHELFIRSMKDPDDGQLPSGVGTPSGWMSAD